MSFLSLYKDIKNPINLDSIDSILDAYVNNSRFYNGIIDINSHGKEVRKYIPYYKDLFNVYLFEEWKRNIHAIRTSGRLNSSYQSIFNILDNYLSNKHPKTTKEVFGILYPVNGDENLKKWLNDFAWPSLGEGTGWNHIDSSYVYTWSHNRQPIEHRLYVNCDSTAVHIICYELARRCKSEKLRYYFKYDEYGDRADNIVIYCSTENIPKFRKILNDIVRECNLQGAVHKPPVLTGVIDGWIGYGSEPKEKDGKRYSFNTKREEHLEYCIKRTTGLWIKNNLNFQIRLNGKQISYGDYFILHLAHTIKEKMLKRVGNSEDALRYYGYTREDVLSPNFDRELKNVLRRNLSTIINCLADGNNNFSLAVPIRGGNFNIPDDYFVDSIKSQIKTIRTISKTYKLCLLKVIKSTSEDFDIDPNNYAFDMHGLELFAIEDNVARMANSTQQTQRAGQKRL